MKSFFLLTMMSLLNTPYLAVSMGNKTLNYCHIAKYSQEVLCGSHSVYEDRVAATGRQIEIQFAVIPSVTEAKELDPLVLLAGGPGQGARDMGAFVPMAFAEIHENRDVVLIDQRGMGASHPLSCEQPEDNILALSEAEQVLQTQKLLQQCLIDLDADVTKYTQDLANQDIHEILLALGYGKVNLYGVSWGTRSALLYANQFPEQVRTVIMDGNAPPDNKVSLYVNEDAEQSLQALFKDCNDNSECHKAFANLEQDFNDILISFGDTGKQVTVVDANTGKPQTFNLTRNIFVSALRGILYIPDFSRLVPIIIQQAKHNNYQTLAGLTAAFGDTGMAIGATLTILCSEELARISDTEIDNEQAKGFVGNAFINNIKISCNEWPKAPLPAIYNQPLTSEIPTLILSGAIDPVTPPKWGAKMADYMTNSRHLIAPNTGHNVAPKGCASKLMAQFVNQGNLEDIDASCLDEIKRPSFFIDTSGPARSLSHD